MYKSILQKIYLALRLTPKKVEKDPVPMSAEATANLLGF